MIIGKSNSNWTRGRPCPQELKNMKKRLRNDAQSFFITNWTFYGRPRVNYRIVILFFTFFIIFSSFNLFNSLIIAVLSIIR